MSTKKPEELLIPGNWNDLLDERGELLPPGPPPPDPDESSPPSGRTV
jgi:hypothetical protein